MRLLASLATLLLALVSLSRAASSTGNTVLVVLEPELKRDDFSTFFNGLEKRGYQLTFREPKDEKPKIIEYDLPRFSHVIFFAPTTKKFAADLIPQNLVSLLSAGTNILIALSPIQTPLTTFASEFSLSLPPPNTPLISHFPARDTPHTTLPIHLPSSHPLLTPNTPPILFSGVPHALGNNPLLVPILRAPPESFATDTEKDSDADVLVDAADKGGEGLWAGSQLGVVTGFQTRKGARITWAGGVSVFGDDFAASEALPGVKSGNAQFSQDVAAWTFQESLVLKIDNVVHHRVGEASPREFYTIKDEVVYTANITKWDPSRKLWRPYSDLKDLQLEFTMLDPHIRTSLPAVPSAPGTYSTTLRLPDRHGVFKFVVNYKRAGYSFLESSTTVPVVPPRHDEYPRFLSAAWPYYAGAISTSLGFLLFCALWLGGASSEKHDRTAGKAVKTE